jgi:hypothetical protein
MTPGRGPRLSHQWESTGLVVERTAVLWSASAHNAPAAGKDADMSYPYPEQKYWG